MNKVPGMNKMERYLKQTQDLFASFCSICFSAHNNKQQHRVTLKNKFVRYLWKHSVQHFPGHKLNIQEEYYSCQVKENASWC